MVGASSGSDAEKQWLLNLYIWDDHLSIAKLLPLMTHLGLEVVDDASFVFAASASCSKAQIVRLHCIRSITCWWGSANAEYCRMHQAYLAR